VGEEQSGRYGFCRYCRGLVEVPTMGDNKRLDDLPAEERVPRLVTLLREAESRYERKRSQLKVLYNKTKTLHEQALQAASLRKSLTQSKARLSEAERTIKRLTGVLPKHAEARGHAEAKLEIVERDISRLERELKAERSGREDAEELLQEQTARCDQLEQLEDSLLQAQVTAVERGALIDRLQEDLAGLSDDPNYSDERLAKLTTELSHLRAEMEIEKTAKNKMEIAMERSQATITRLESDLEQASNGAEEAWAEADRLRDVEKELEATIARLEESQSVLNTIHPELAIVTQALGNAEARADERAQQVDTLKAQLDVLHHNQSEVEARIRDAEKQAFELDHLQTRVTSLEDEKAALQDELNDARAQQGTTGPSLEAVLEAATGLQRDLREELHKLMLQLPDRAELEARLNVARISADRAQEQVETLQTRSGDAGSLERELAAERQRREDSEAQVERLRLDLENLAEQSGGDAEQSAQSTLEYERVQTALEAERAEALQLREALDEVRRDLDRSAGRSQILEEELERSREQAAAHQDDTLDAKILAGKLEETEAVLERMTAELKAASQLIGGAESRASENERNVARLATELAEERKAKHEAEIAQKAAEVRAAISDRKGEQVDMSRMIPSSLDGDANDDALALMPELIDGDGGDEQDELVDTLLRFIDSKEQEE
jgi:chromosome segregation ATPase